MRSKRSWRNAAILIVLAIAACAPREDNHEFRFFALGTAVTLKFYGVDETRAQNAATALESYFAAVGHNWYPWSDGELRALNVALAEGRDIDVSPELGALIARAIEVEAISDGRFNAGLAQLTELWGFHLPGEPALAVPSPESISGLMSAGPAASRLGSSGSRWWSDSAQVGIDLGGIAKGAILAEAVVILDAHGISNAIIDLGGDLCVIGSPGSRPARIGIRSPSGGEPLGILEVEDGETVVTSGNYERFVEIDGRRYTHVLDPSTGYPVEHTASVTVVHRDPVMADAAATALMVGGPEQFDALAAAFELKAAILIDTSGDVRLTPGMRKRLNWSDDGNK